MSHTAKNLKKELHHHGGDYMVLLISGLIYLALLKISQGQKLISFLITVAFVAFYIFWAIFHHTREEIRDFKNVLEYVLIGVTILLFISLVFFN